MDFTPVKGAYAVKTVDNVVKVGSYEVCQHVLQKTVELTISILGKLPVFFLEYRSVPFTVTSKSPACITHYRSEVTAHHVT